MGFATVGDALLQFSVHALSKRAVAVQYVYEGPFIIHFEASARSSMANAAPCHREFIYPLQWHKRSSATKLKLASRTSPTPIMRAYINIGVKTCAAMP